jgi:hypothetical protein
MTDEVKGKFSRKGKSWGRRPGAWELTGRD